MKGNYKGYDIEYNMSRNEFVAHMDGDDYRNDDLKKVHAYIDRLKKSKFKKISAYFVPSYGTGKVKKVTITSVVNEHGTTKAWITTEAGDRSKESIEELYEMTASNKKIITDIGLISSEIEELENRKEKLYAKLKPLTISESDIIKDE